MVPVLVFLVVFCDTLYPTDPFPVPLAPEVMVIHESLLLAVQLQFVPAITVTLIVPVPPAVGNDLLVGEME